MRGFRSLKALEFKKWRGLEPSSLIKVYAYEYSMLNCILMHTRHTIIPITAVGLLELAVAVMCIVALTVRPCSDCIN